MPIDESTASRTATELSGEIRRGELRSRDLLELYLDRVDRLNPLVNAVVTLDAQRARDAADQADRDAANGIWHGPIHGLPTTIKDAIEVAGVRSTGGAIELRDHVPVADAPSVQRLRQAGAIVFGKTNVPRWSGDLQTYNDIFGTTNNPWDVTRTPGGSSGGAATAVASGLTSFEVGTDIGGSVRMPAHLTGVFGHKPSYGVISQRGYLDHAAGGTIDADVNVFGPLARSASDLDLLLGVLAGPNQLEATAWKLELPAPSAKPLSQLRIGVWLDGPDTPPMLREQRDVIDNAIDKLRASGAHVEPVAPVSFEASSQLFFHLLTAATSPSMMYGEGIDVSGSHLDWLRAQQARAQLMAQWSAWFETFDVLICPVMPTPAFRHDTGRGFLDRRFDIDGVARPHTDGVAWTGLIGVAHLPSTVAPIGRTASGMPVGVQVVGAHYRDRETIRVAGDLAAVCGGGYVTPPLMA